MHAAVCGGVRDDHSRLTCHTLWHLDLSTDSLGYQRSQAIMKGSIPRCSPRGGKKHEVTDSDDADDPSADDDSTQDDDK